MSLLILGDCHLGKGAHLTSALGQASSPRIHDQEKLLLYTLETAESLGVTDLILTGDIFEEPHPHQSLLLLFLKWLRLVSQKHINVHIIRGNHCVFRSGQHYSSPLDLVVEAGIKRVHVYQDMETIFVGERGITLMPFRDRKSLLAKTKEEALLILEAQLAYQLANIPSSYKKILVGHMALEGSMFIDEIDDVTNEIMCPISLFSGYDYVWMGHVHTPQIISVTPYLAHVGSMDQSNFSEQEEKIIVHFDKVHRNLVLPTRKMKAFSFIVPQGEDPTDFVLASLEKEDLAKCIIRVEVNSPSESVPLKKAKVTSFLASKNVFSIEGIRESRKTVLIKKELNKKLDTKIEVPEAIVEFANKNVNEEIRSAFIELSKSIVLELQEKTK